MRRADTQRPTEIGTGELLRRLADPAVRAARLVARVRVRQWPAVLHVVGLWAVVELGLRVSSLPRLAATLGVPLALSVPEIDDAPRPRWEQAELDAMSLALKVLRRRPFDGTCLRRSLVVGHLIRHRAPRLCLGAKKIAGQVSAHAWLEIDRAFVDVEEPDSFVPEHWKRF
ncbi:MAG: lasso peptide biosynthesis B2 protein [Propionibacteriaceae bacterium]